MREALKIKKNIMMSVVGMSIAAAGRYKLIRYKSVLHWNPV
jgi:hypothetical protein